MQFWVPGRNLVAKSPTISYSLEVRHFFNQSPKTVKNILYKLFSSKRSFDPQKTTFHYLQFFLPIFRKFLAGDPKIFKKTKLFLKKVLKIFLWKYRIQSWQYRRKALAKTLKFVGWYPETTRSYKMFKKLPSHNVTADRKNGKLRKLPRVFGQTSVFFLLVTWRTFLF